jgi:hypothetical protein
MDKDTIFLMLDNIKKSGRLGPKTGSYTVGERVGFALDKELIKRLDTGSFIVTEKGNNLLENKISWDSL